jgi:NADH-quinone oxidoreductase subunit N
VIPSGVTAYFYVRVVVSMFFTEATDDAARVVAPAS